MSIGMRKVKPQVPLVWRYRLRRVTSNFKCLETVVPFVLIEREARQHGLSIEEFIKRYETEWLLDRAEITLRFVVIDHNKAKE